MSQRAAGWWLLALTVMSAALRFSRLSFPPPLTDEAFTYWRTCGSFSQLLDAIRPDAFVPLHYVIVWCLTKVFGHEIWVLRLPGAFAGTLAPLGIYLLGRVLGSRRVGVYAACLAACSGWFGFFSHDAKMYMPAWCELTFAVAGALLYARTGNRRTLAWATFAGVMAANTHAVTLLILPLTPIAVAAFARTQRWWRTAIAVAMLAIVLVGPVTYYTTFSRWYHDAGGLSGVDEDGKPAGHDNGLQWIDRWQAGRSPGNILLSCVSSYLFAYELPPEAPAEKATWDANWGAAEAYVVARALFWFLAAVVLAATVRVVARRKPSVQLGRKVFVVGVLLAVPLYGFYLRSFTSLRAPWQLIPGGVASLVLIAVLGAIVLSGRPGFSLPWRRPPQSRRSFDARLANLSWLAGLLIVMTMTWAAMRFAHAHSARWNPLWMARYSGVVAPFLFVIAAGLFAKLPGRWVRLPGFGLLLVANLLATGARLFTSTEWPYDLECRDMIRAADDHSVLLLRDYANIPGVPIVSLLPGPYYDLAIAAHLDLTPETFRAGNSWPYRIGPGLRSTLASIHITPLWAAGASPGKPATTELIVWLGSERPPPTFEGWQLSSQHAFTVRHVWTWTITNHARRLTYRRGGDASQLSPARGRT